MVRVLGFYIGFAFAPAEWKRDFFSGVGVRFGSVSVSVLANCCLYNYGRYIRSRSAPVPVPRSFVPVRSSPFVRSFPVPVPRLNFELNCLNL